MKRKRAQRSASSAASRYTIHRDGTVVDEWTGFAWQRAVSPQYFTWREALSYCDSVAEVPGSGWRLPSLGELLTILHNTRRDPAIEATAFPNTPSAAFWTSSPTVDSPNDIWCVCFGSGLIYRSGEDCRAQVRCVRREPPADRYTILDDATALDNRTGLAWQRRSSARLTWDKALGYPKSIDAGLHGERWRLPSVEEPNTIVDRSRRNPAIDTEVFPNTPSEWFWSSSGWPCTSSKTWGVNFTDGSSGYGYSYFGVVNSEYCVRLVR